MLTISGVTTWWQLILGLAGGLLLLWLALLALLWRAQWKAHRQVTAREALRLLPDVLRVLRRLAADAGLPRGLRVRLVLLLGYLLLPVDLVPDFIPVLGYADDAVIVALALRSVTRRAGPDALARHWPGTPDGLHVVQRLAGIAETSTADGAR